MALGDGVLLEAARGATSLSEYERAAIEHVLRSAGAEVAMFVRAGGPGEYGFGFEPSLRRALRRSWQSYGRELSGFAQTAHANGGIGVDLEYFGRRKLERLSYYREIMLPHRGRSTMFGYLSCGRRKLGALVLGRCSASFTAAECERVQQMLPALSVCEAAVHGVLSEPSHSEAHAGLTPREKEILSFLALGYTNREIALACGSAPHTVRNQLSSVYAKLGVSTRAEAVGLGMRRR